jgi:thymidine phosphorylase
MVHALGGPSDILEHPDAHLDRAPVVREVFADRDGVVAAHDTRALGIAVMNLGGGRAVESDVIDAAVGLDAVSGPGTAVGPGGRPLAVVHARDEAGADVAEAAVRAAIAVGDSVGVSPPVVAEVLR